MATLRETINRVTLSPLTPAMPYATMSDATSRAAPFRFLPLGDAALTIEYGDTIDPASNARAIAVADQLRAEHWEGVVDLVPAYRSLTIHIDPRRTDLTTLADRVRRLSYSLPPVSPSPGRQHSIPVWYGGDAGPDLEKVAAAANLSSAEVIRMHSSVVYRVYMLGFSPGFPYLGSVPDPLVMPRLATPRVKVPAGSVGIAEQQTGIYPTATPGGWHLIGRTPVALYRRASATPFLLGPGDTVQFVPIDQPTFDHLRQDQHDDAP
jgi:inhibitor of KinA